MTSQTQVADNDMEELSLFMPFYDDSILHPFILYFLWQFIFYKDASNTDVADDDSLSNSVRNDRMQQSSRGHEWFDNTNTLDEVLMQLKQNIGSKEFVMELCRQYAGCGSRLLYYAFVSNDRKTLDFILQNPYIPLEDYYLMLKCRDDARFIPFINQYIRLGRIEASENLVKLAIRYGHLSILKSLITNIGEPSQDLMQEMFAVAYNEGVNDEIVKFLQSLVNSKDVKIKLVQNAFEEGNDYVGKCMIERLGFMDHLNAQVVIGIGPLNLSKYYIEERLVKPNRTAYSTSLYNENVDIANLITDRFGILPMAKDLHEVCKKGLFKSAKYLLSEKRVASNDFSIVYAISSGNNDLVFFLLNDGYASPSRLSLEVSCYMGNLEIFRFLMESFKPDEIPQSCLDAAVFRGNSEIADELLKMGMKHDDYTKLLSDNILSGNVNFLDRIAKYFRSQRIQYLRSITEE